MKVKKIVAFLINIILLGGLILFGKQALYAQPSYKMAKLKYNGGGDWYANRTALPNLISFCNQNIKTNFYPNEAIVEASSTEIFNYPLVYLTGHGNITFNKQETINMRNYLLGGGFLHIDDNYGLDKFIRPQMKKVFPELDFVELPPTHAIYNQTYKFTKGLPKIHEHDGKRPQGFALIYKSKIICFYTYECDLGNGWEDFGTYPEDTQASRQKALKMGANIVEYVFGL
ncbi:MAG: DUF4159 domain-containing protein [Sphingobacteriales bacterium]|nr:MAG: DUF4159 domain-containing protein [Sphingobacteriales bacterium]TAF83135.1 MAG: DUF4159 domain-containing protein [Sphingobacteriales bacterium]